MKRKWFAVVGISLVSLLLATLLSACVPKQGTETPTTIPAAAETPSAPSSGLSPSRSPSPDTPSPGISWYGVSFQVEPSLAEGVQTDVVDAFTDDGGFGYTLLPKHLSFVFQRSYADEDAIYHRQQLNLAKFPQIVVYPVASYAAMQDSAGRQVEHLCSLLADRPAEPGGDLPYLPLINAAQALHAQVTYLDFANGAGMRYIVQFAQETRPVNNQELIYTFQGITNDGAYYVAAFFPVTTSILPDTPQVADDDAFARSFSVYVRETKAALGQLFPGDFTPNLAWLDTVVTSLRVEPDVELDGGETALSEDNIAFLPLRAPAAGLVYRVSDDGLWIIGGDGEPQQLTERNNALPAPDLAHAVYMDDDRHLWLINLADGSERQLAEGVDLSWLYQWGDAHTLLVTVWLSPEESDGDAIGHVATLDIRTGDLQVVDEQCVSLGRPALAPDGRTVAYDLSPYCADIVHTGWTYHPKSGSQPIDSELFEGLAGERPWHLSNPAWSPDGAQLALKWGAVEESRLVVFDLVRRAAMIAHTWSPAQFGALPPSPVWSPDGQWLAIEVWASGEEESGLWVLPADGTAARLHDPTGREPVWLNPSQLMYAVFDQNMNNTVRLYDLHYGGLGTLDLPAGSTVLLAPT